MKFVCSTEQLSLAAHNVQRAVSMKTTLPALESIRIEAQEDGLILTGYDLEFGIITSIPARVEEKGSILINARIFCDIVKKLPAENVRIESDELFTANIVSGEAKYSIKGTSPDEFPELPSVTGGIPIVINQGVLKEMVRQTIFAVAVQDANKVIHTGIKFTIVDKTITLVAVDGFRLAIRKEVIDYDGEEVSFVVPAKTMSELVKLTMDDDSDVSLGIGKRHIVFTVGEYSIISRLLEGEFLNYKTAIPSSNSTVVSVNTKTLIDSIERTSLIISDRLATPLRCLFNDNAVKISSITQIGTATDRVPIEMKGEVVEIGFNNRFLLDALRVADTDEVKIELNGSVSPIIITPPEGDAFMFIVLPVRLKAE